MAICCGNWEFIITIAPNLSAAALINTQFFAHLIPFCAYNGADVCNDKPIYSPTIASQISLSRQRLVLGGMVIIYDVNHGIDYIHARNLQIKEKIHNPQNSYCSVQGDGPLEVLWILLATCVPKAKVSIKFSALWLGIAKMKRNQ